MQEKTALVFTHLPKTGGITLRSIINTEYILRRGKSFTFWEVNDLNKFNALSDAEKRRINVIKGHSPFGVHTYFPYPVQYFTMLREPVKRAISAYNFARTFRPHRLYEKLRDNNYSLKQLLESGLNKGQDNCYVRFLCGVQDIPYGCVTDEHLAMALHNLKTYYAVVGITEHFNESILLFAKQFKWHTPYYIKENKTPPLKTATVLDDETMELLKFYNRYDTVLYKAALDIFNKQVLQAGQGFKNEVLQFEKDNKKRTLLTKVIFFYGVKDEDIRQKLFVANAILCPQKNKEYVTVFLRIKKNIRAFIKMSKSIWY